VKEALYSESRGNGRVQCLFCPHGCLIDEGQQGVCHVRENRSGVLYSMNYARVSALHLDPVEKKPLYHFFPGKQILSVGSVGCNLDCSFCQNCEISNWKGKGFEGLQNLSAEELVKKAQQITGNIGIAYTYNEPVVFFEYMLETAWLAQSAGLQNVMVSNGYLLEKPLDDLLKCIHAFNIDLKAFRSSFYIKHTGAGVKPVLKTLENIKASDRYLEITNLLIPGLNDSPEELREMVKWISKELGQATVLHLSRYFPRHRMSLPPTPQETLKRMYMIAKEYLHHVYLGNIESGTGNDTRCPECDLLLIHRIGYQVSTPGLSPQGTCNSCGHPLAIVQALPLME
jgi:pyruvate formate lyase activating enzyme